MDPARPPWHGSVPLVEPPIPSDTTTRPWWGWLRAAVLVVAVVAIAVVLYRSRDDLLHLLDIQPWQVVTLVLLQGALLLAQAWQQHVLISRTGGAVPFLAWTRLFLVARVVNTLVPQGGHVVRAASLKQDHGIAVGDYASMVLAFSWLGSIQNLVMAAALLGVLVPGMRVLGVPGWALALAAAVLVSVVPPAAVLLLRAVGPRDGLSGRLLSKGTSILAKAVDAARHPAVLAAFLGVGVVLFVLATAITHLAFLTAGATPSVAESGLVFSIAQVGNYVNVTPGNLGVMELLYSGTGAAVGASAGQSLIAAAAIRASGYLALILVGLPTGGSEIWRSLRRRTREDV